MNLHETAMGQRFFNVQLPALINTLKDIAAALSRPAPSAISFPADQHFLTSLYYGEYEADVFKPDKRLAPFNQAVQQKEKALLPLLSNEASIAFEQYQAAVQCRNSTVLEQAYASGYRTAVQMFARPTKTATGAGITSFGPMWPSWIATTTTRKIPGNG